MTALLRREVLNKVPPVCGVYLFYDAGNRLLYVGKSKNLRRRMAGYFSGNGINRETRPAWRWGRIGRFDWVETPSELTALLLEDFWIKKLKPRWNIRQAQMKERCWLLLDPLSIPPFRIVLQPERAKWCIGPLKDHYFAETLWLRLARFLQLPDCLTKLSHSCLKMQTGRCLAPCKHGLDDPLYRKAWEKLLRILSGEVTNFQNELRREMITLSHRLEFEKAGRLKEEIKFWENYRKRQLFLNRFGSETLLLWEDSAGGIYHLFSKKGYSFWVEKKKEAVGEQILAARMRNKKIYSVMRTFIEDSRLHYDAGNIVYQYIQGRHQNLRMRWLPEPVERVVCRCGLID